MNDTIANSHPAYGLFTKVDADSELIRSINTTIYYIILLLETPELETKNMQTF